mgnify:CR=1 FL=1
MQSKKIYLFGSNGFIANGFKIFFNEKKIKFYSINKSNYLKYKNTYCDIFFNLNGSSSKILAEKDFLKSFKKNITSTVQTFNDFKIGKYVYISSCSVYNDVQKKNKTKESSKIDVNLLNNYGFLKVICEQIVKREYKNFLIIRPSGFVGQGLKKNVIFDLMNKKKLYENKNISFNFIDTKYFAEIVYKLSQKKNNKIYNVAAKKSIKVSEINNFFFKKNVKFTKSNLKRNEICVSKLLKFTKVDTSQNYINLYFNKL